jgi:hypothetical protein
MPTRRALSLPLAEPIVPVVRDWPLDDPAYLFEPKYDGFRGWSLNAGSGTSAPSSLLP